MTTIDKQNATALPTPCDVATACRKLVCALCETRYKCSAVVQITSTNVVTYDMHINSGRETKNLRTRDGKAAFETPLCLKHDPHRVLNKKILTPENKNVKKAV